MLLTEMRLQIKLIGKPETYSH